MKMMANNDSATRGVSRLTLRTFRQFSSLDMRPDPSIPMILVGQNGSGKTSLLEALSLLGGGKGLRGGDMEGMTYRAELCPALNASEKNIDSLNGSIDNEEDHGARCVFSRVCGSVSQAMPQALSDRGFSIRVEYGNAVKAFQLHYVQGAGLKTYYQRHARLSRRKVRDHIPTLWLTPWFTYRFLTNSVVRLRTLDKVIEAVNADHSPRTSRLQRHIQTRLTVLRQSSVDKFYLETLEKDIAQTMTVVLADRLLMVDRLRPYMERVTGSFAKADLRLVGKGVDLLMQGHAQKVEQTLFDLLVKNRQQDTERGTLTDSPHRPTLELIERQRNLDVQYASTGEQHSLLFTFLYALMRFYLDSLSATPLILLDDVFAHLDDKRRMSIQEHFADLPICLWMSGVNQELFSGIAGNCQLINLD